MLFESITDMTSGVERLRRRPFGVIHMVDNHLAKIRLRPFPKLGTPEALLLARWYHRRATGNQCRIYYNQPWQCPNYLALKFFVSTRDCTVANALGALRVLDEIARIKQSNAIVCDVSNWRISDRQLQRWGWEAHCPQRWHRNYIKRFYGDYPPPLQQPSLAPATLAVHS